jgi:RNA polymerase sigma-54 factor
MHESTVSRVVNNKYMHTPRGLFEMKFFFHSGIASVQGEDVSSLAVKERIKKLVAEENPSRPLSDSALAKLLGEEGLQIARRTVAKYREELRIPSSNDRRQGFR